MHHPFHISNDEDSKRIIVLSQHVVNKHIQNHSVMQKAASMASVLVLIFTPAVLIFRQPTSKICLV